MCVTSKITRELAYNTFVQPYLEYASLVWSPWQSYLEDTLEKVQRQAAQYVCNKYGIISVTILINDLKWDTLKVRRILCLMYKIHHCLVNIPLNEYTLQSTITHTRNSHQHKILPILANKNPFHYSFYQELSPSGTVYPLI